MPRLSLTETQKEEVYIGISVHEHVSRAVIRANLQQFHSRMVASNNRNAFVQLYLYFKYHNNLPRTTVASRVKGVRLRQPRPGVAGRCALLWEEVSRQLVRDPFDPVCIVKEFALEFLVLHDPSHPANSIFSTLVLKKDDDQRTFRRMAWVKILGQDLSQATVFIETPWSTSTRGTFIILSGHREGGMADVACESVELSAIGHNVMGDNVLSCSFPISAMSRLGQEDASGMKVVLKIPLDANGLFLSTTLSAVIPDVPAFSHLTLIFEFLAGVPMGDLWDPALRGHSTESPSDLFQDDLAVFPYSGTGENHDQLGGYHIPAQPMASPAPSCASHVE